jgi:hypothetical protein
LPDLAIVASQVIPVAGSQTRTQNAAVAITAGKVVYLNSSNLWALAQCDGTDAEVAAVGFAVNDAAVGQPCTVVTGGLLILGSGAAPVAAQIYCVSATPGGACPYADLVSTNKLFIVAIGKTLNQITVIPYNGLVAKP